MAIVQSGNCNQCNEVAEKGISSESAKKSIQANCIVVKLQEKELESYSLVSLAFFSKDFFGTIFFDGDKNILDVMPGSTSMSSAYHDHIEKALKEKNTISENFAVLKKNYFINIGNFSTNMKLIAKILSFQLEPSQELVDELTVRAPLDSASSISFLQFIMRAAPMVGSNAQAYINKVSDNYNMAWYRMSLQERMKINGRIGNKSLQKAIQDKDRNYAYQVASFKQQTYNRNYEEGQKANQQVMLEYYRGVNDTADYLKNVSLFYEKYYMTISAEKVKQEDSAQLKAMLKQAPAVDTVRESNDKKTFIVKKAVSFAPRGQYYANALNEGAWTVYTYTKDINYLKKAMSWAKHGLELYQSPEVMDTYARLLYKTNNTEEAILCEQKAIDLKKSTKYSATEFEKILAAMQKGESKIDEY